VWGLAAAAAAYLVLLPVQQALLARSTAARPETEAA
jgi:hypothetical protein